MRVTRAVLPLARDRLAAWLRLLLFPLLLAFVAASPASAQTAPPAPVAATPSAAELQSLVETLQDETARATLVKQLQALIAAQRPAAEAPAEPADFVSRLTQRLNVAADELLVGAAAVLDAPRLLDWVTAQVTEEAARARWLNVIIALVVVFGVAVLAEWVLRRVLARVGQYAPAPNGNGRARIVLAVLAVLIEAAPVAGFGLGALAAMAIMLPPNASGSEAIRVLVWATAGIRLLIAIAKAVLVPHPDWPSLVPASEETRNYLLIWVRRFAFWGIFGFAVVEAAWWLGAPGGILGVTQKGIALVLATLAIVFLLQNRAAVGKWIAGEASEAAVGWKRLRRHLAETWHILAIVYIVAVYLVFSLHQEGGSAYVVRATALSLVTVAAARLLMQFVERLSDRGFAIAPDLKERFPLIEQRANRYLHVVVKLATFAIYGLAVLAVMQAWDLGVFAWFQTEFGRRAAGAVLSITVVLAIALAGWEVLSAAIERSLAALDQAGAPSRTRRRTLLPLLRTALLCVIVAIAALTVLSEIGINIAPLLAGAGVIGIAVGFGSQALIKDVITGLFILIEDQVAVGDIVDLGKEHAGVVEAITIRTIRLRDLNGVVHTVPFGEVTSVKNLTKDFAFVVARIAVAYGEDTDAVVEILRGVCDELAEDPELGPLILDRFDYLGVDRLDEFSVVLLLRVRTLPAKQWTVGRALNRRIKLAFDKHGIAMRDPSPVKITGPSLAALGDHGRAGQIKADAEAEAEVAAGLRRTA